MKDRFSSDGANLNPTARSFNASKGSRTPDQLTGIAARIIDTAAEQCAYARQHRAVKREGGLTLTAPEQATSTTWLAGCGTTNGAAASAPAPVSESRIRCDPSYPDVCIPPAPPAPGGTSCTPPLPCRPPRRSPLWAWPAARGAERAVIAAGRQ